MGILCEQGGVNRYISYGAYYLIESTINNMANEGDLK